MTGSADAAAPASSISTASTSGRQNLGVGSDSILTLLIEQHWGEIRHQEDQRQQFNQWVLGGEVISAAFLTYAQTTNSKGSPLAILVVTLAVFGCVGTMKFRERYRFCQSRLNHWYAMLRQSPECDSIFKVRDKADEEHAREFRRLIALPVWLLWVSVHATIGLYSIVMGLM